MYFKFLSDININWDLVAQSAAGSLFGAIGSIIVTVFLLSLDCRLIVEDHPNGQRTLKSAGTSKAYITNITGERKFKKLYLNPGSFIDLPSGIIGGEVRYKRYRWMPFPRIVTYGKYPNFFSRHFLKRVKKADLNKQLKGKFPKIFISWKLNKMLKIPNSGKFKLTVCFDANRVFFLIEDSLIPRDEGGTGVYNMDLNFPIKFLSHTAKVYLRSKPNNENNQMHWNISTGEIKSLIKYLSSIRAQLDYRRFNKLKTPLDIFHNVLHTSKLNKDELLMNANEVKLTFYHNATTRKKIGADYVSNSETEMGFSIYKPSHVADSSGLLFEEKSEKAMSGKATRTTTYILVRNDGLVIILSGINAPDYLKLSATDVEKLKALVQHWKEW